jgi:hypothetical protein
MTTSSKTMRYYNPDLIRYPLPPKVEHITPTKSHRSFSFLSCEKRRKTHQQFQCLFLRKLPTDVRLLIYQEVIRSWGWTRRLHIVEKDIDYRRGNRTPLSYIICKFATMKELGSPYDCQHLRIPRTRDDPLGLDMKSVSRDIEISHAWRPYYQKIIISPCS